MALGLILAAIPKARAADLAVGDSIACGTGRALGLRTICREGAGSCEIAGWRVPQGTAWDRLVVSAGINDGGACVKALRGRLRAQRVIWILPAPINGGRDAVLKAMRPGDRSVSYECTGGCTKKNFHPASYDVVGDNIKDQW